METVTAPPKTAVQIMEASEQWGALTPRLKMWCATYSLHRDAVAATRAVYKCKTDHNAKIMSYEIRKHKNVSVCIALLDGKTERDIFIDGLRETIQRAPAGGHVRLRAQALLARLLYGVTEPEESDADEPKPKRKRKSSVQKFKVGDIVKQEGKNYRVTEVDADGAIVNAEDI